VKIEGMKFMKGDGGMKLTEVLIEDYLEFL
jgi:hypothetical protein